MPRSIACHEIETLFNAESSRRLRVPIQRVARRQFFVEALKGGSP